MWDVCIEILNDLSQAPGDDITTLNGKCSFPLAAAGVTADQPWSRARGVLLQIPGRTFCFCGTNGVGMSAYWWWLWRLRGDSGSSLRALCAWTREYVVINFFFLSCCCFFTFLNLTKIIPTWAQRMGGLWALEKRSRPAVVGVLRWKLCNCEMFKTLMHHEKTRDEDPPSATQRWFSMIYLLSLALKLGPVSLSAVDVTGSDLCSSSLCSLWWCHPVLCDQSTISCKHTELFIRILTIYEHAAHLFMCIITKRQ